MQHGKTSTLRPRTRQEPCMVDKCGIHAATLLLQRLANPPRYDLRARADVHVASQQATVHEALFQSLAAVFRCEVNHILQMPMALSAQLGGCSITPSAKAQVPLRDGRRGRTRSRQHSEPSRSCVSRSSPHMVEDQLVGARHRGDQEDEELPEIRASPRNGF